MWTISWQGGVQDRSWRYTCMSSPYKSQTAGSTWCARLGCGIWIIEPTERKQWSSENPGLLQGSWGSNSCTRFSQAERGLQRERGSGECGVTFAGCLAFVLFRSTMWNVKLSAKSWFPAVSFWGPFLSLPLWFLSVAEFLAHELCRLVFPLLSESL